ncbi:MAG: cation:proton antiporter [Paramuribaculum sp.]|nr:cation:proton antiporter [Paramuribaculum sp.]
MISLLALAVSEPLLTSPVDIFLCVLLLILFVPLILNVLKVPPVIGLILAGVIVGPHGFNLLARDMSFEVFGQVGILYLMFLAGIEIDMYHLRKNLRRGVIFGLYTFFIPLVIGSVGAYYVLGLNVIASLLVASMFSAHTLIAYPIVSRLGLTKSSPVIIAIAGTIFTVLGSLMVLAIAVGIEREGEFRPGNILTLLGGLALYCLLVVYIYPRLTRWFFKSHGDNITQFIYVLAMTFLAAVGAGAIGVEGVFGAFFAGIVLNRYIPLRSPLMTRLEFVGNAIFIPYFLIGVGMLIDVSVLAKGWSTIYVAGVMSAIAMSSKWIAAYCTQRTFRLSTTARSIMYQLSNAHTAVALAVVMIGYGMGIFGEEILNGTVIMILVTCTVSSVGTSRAATKLKVEQLAEDTPAQVNRGNKRMTNVLIPVASPAAAPELVDLALLMRSPQSKGNVYALHVRNDNSASSRAIGRNALDIAEQVAASVDVPIRRLERYDLNVVTGVINTIEERDISEVIIGLHRRNSIIDTFFGDKLTELIKATHRMVVITRCFIPVNTVTRIVVIAPDKAQFETGFCLWVESLANLARQVGCRLIFCGFSDTCDAIRAVIHRGGYGIRSEYRVVEEFDDFILLANKVLDDDLFVFVSSRRAAVSFTAELDTMPEFLHRYFQSNNLLVIYPEQFGEDVAVPTMAETMTSDLISEPSRLWISMMKLYRGIAAVRRRISPRHKHHKDKDRLKL